MRHAESERRGPRAGRALHTIAFVLMAAAGLPAAALEPEGRLPAGLYAGFSFGGGTWASDARAGLRLDAGPAPVAHATPLLRWELRRDATEFAVAGQPVLSHSFVARYQDGETATPGSRVSWTLLAIAAGAALTAAIVDETGEAFSEAAAEGAESTAIQVLGGGQAEDEDSPPPCDIEIADNCVGG